MIRDVPMDEAIWPTYEHACTRCGNVLDIHPAVNPADPDPCQCGGVYLPVRERDGFLMSGDGT